MALNQIHPPCQPGKSTEQSIHATLCAAVAILERAELSVQSLDSRMFGPYPESDSKNLASVNSEPSVESLAIGLRTRLDILADQIGKIRSRV